MRTLLYMAALVVAFALHAGIATAAPAGPVAASGLCAAETVAAAKELRPCGARGGKAAILTECAAKVNLAAQACLPGADEHAVGVGNPLRAPRPDAPVAIDPPPPKGSVFG